jgi:hypothetical protein
MDKLCKELNIIAKSALKKSYEIVVKELYSNQSTPMYGLNKLVNPKQNEKYSRNLYRWLTYGKYKLFTNIFQDDRGILYIGLREDNAIWCGARLANVACRGCSAATFSATTALSKEWIDITVQFWTRYLRLGKKGFKKIWFLG